MMVACNKAHLRLIWTAFAWTLSIGGFIAQVYYITEVLLRRDTVNQVTVEQNGHLRPPKLVLCSHSYIFNTSLVTSNVITYLSYFDNGELIPVLSEFDDLSIYISVKKFFRDVIYTCYSISVLRNVTVDTKINGIGARNTEYLTFMPAPPLLSSSKYW